MILKSLSRKSGTPQLLNYLFEKKEKLSDEKHSPLLIKHNIRSQSLDKWAKEFEENESHRLVRRKDSVQAYHTVLSFSHKDKEKVNEKVLKDIAKEYIKLRGENNLYIAIAHYDKDHVHLHIAMSGTQYLTGISSRISKKDFHQLKVALDKYQQEKYPQLSNSLPSHGKGSKPLSRSENENIKRNERTSSQKETLLELLETSYAKSSSVKDFISSLEEQGHQVYYRSGKLTGVKFEGDRKFRFSRLGYDKEKIAELDRIQLKQEENLRELQDLREEHSNQREEEDDRDFERDEDDHRDDEKDTEDDEIEEKDDVNDFDDVDDESDDDTPS